VTGTPPIAPQEHLALLDALFDASPVGVGFWDAELRYRRVNEALARIDGAPAEAHIGRRPSEVLGEFGERLEAVFRRVLSTGEAEVGVELVARLPGATEDQVRQSSYYPVLVAGEVVGIGGVIQDVTDRRRAEDERRRLFAMEAHARARAELLERVGGAVSASLDWQETLANITRAIVPELADWCTVVLRDGDRARMAAVAHPDPEMERWAWAMQERFPPRLDDDTGSAVAIREARPVADFEVTAERIEEAIPDPELVEIMKGLQPTSAISVPLLDEAGHAIGALNLMYATSGRHYGPDDVLTAQALADRAAIAVRHALVHAEAEQRLALLDATYGSTQVGLAFIDTELRFQRINDVMAAINGRPVAEHLGRTVGEMLGPMADEVAGILRRVLDTGAPLRDVELSGRLSGDPDRVAHYLASYAPVKLGDQVAGVTAAVIEVTSRVEAERERERAHERTAFLLRLGEQLDRSLDYEQAIQILAGTVAGRVADACVIHELDGAGGLRRVAVAHADPAWARRASELLDAHPIEDERWIEAQVAQTGSSVHIARFAERHLQVLAGEDPRFADGLRTLAVRSLIAVPLRARGRMLGTATLLATGESAPFGPDDVAFAEELARRAALAADNARLLSDHKRIAQTLQSRLLPREIPEPPGAEIAVRYRAAGEHNVVGGDFYDVFERAPGEWVAVVGDVAGKGAEAAALTAQIRHTLRAASRVHGSPGGLLHAVHDELRRELEAGLFCTMAAVVVRREGAALVGSVALGGHPAALAIRGGGTAEEVGRTGTLLGAIDPLDVYDTGLRLEAGDALLLYTDGVTEADPRNDDWGEEELRDFVAGLAGSSAAEVADRVVGRVIDVAGGLPRDDVALVVLRMLSEP
jgi:PAS domain S-box-containing protein